MLPEWRLNSQYACNGKGAVYEEDLNTLQDLLRRLKVEYDIFFNGNRKRPPEDMRARLDKLVKRLSNATDMTFSERFQFNTLVARFHLYCDLWRRTMNRQEAASEDEVSLQEPKGDLSGTPQTPQQFRVSIEDPNVEPEKVRDLYEALIKIGGERAKSAPRPSYEQFANYIAAQTASIRKKFHCAGVVFTLALEEDRVKFRATAA
jgi:hypothetical protein